MSCHVTGKSFKGTGARALVRKRRRGRKEAYHEGTRAQGQPGWTSVHGQWGLIAGLRQGEWCLWCGERSLNQMWKLYKGQRVSWLLGLPKCPSPAPPQFWSPHTRDSVLQSFSLSVFPLLPCVGYQAIVSPLPSIFWFVIWELEHSKLYFYLPAVSC